DVVGIKQTRICDHADDTFRFVGDMTWRRWYPSLVTLSDGRVLVLSGVEQIVRPEGVPFGVRYNNVTQPEIYDPKTRAWTLMADGPYSWPVYPHLHLMPGGKVLYPGTGYVWVQGGTTLDELSWSEQQLYDAATDTWTEVGQAKYGA